MPGGFPGKAGQFSMRAHFLLAWWNSGRCGAFDLTSLWALDADIATNVTTVFGVIGRIHRHPDSQGYEPAFKVVVQASRPELGD